MKILNKLGLVAAAAMLAGVTAQAAPYAEGDLLLGFTDGNAAHSDLVLDLGPISSLGAGVLNPSGTPGKVGEDAPTLLAELNSLYGGLGSVKFGAVAATFVNSSTFSTYSTVPHGGTAPSLGAAGNLSSAVDTVGGAIGDGSGPTANSQLYMASAGFGLSWTENIQGASSLWGLNATVPSYAASATSPTTLDLYGRVNGSTLALLDTITLGTDGTVTVTPAAVPEPTAYGVLAGLGLLVVALRRQLRGESV